MPLPDAAPQPASPPPEPGRDGPADAVLFTRIVGHALGERDRSLTEALGLSRDALAALVARHTPALAADVAALPGDAGPGADELEEADLRDFLLEHRAGTAVEEEWLAAIIARRTLAMRHLWQDMGFANRTELSTTIRRHFPALAALNAGDMRWKKFFYRQLCSREGFLVCKSPNCDDCEDRAECFTTD